MSDEAAKTLQAHKLNLDRLRLQAAQHGIDVPLELQNAIAHEQAQIAEIEREMDATAQKAVADDTEERIARLYGELATLAMEAAGYGSKAPQRLEQQMAQKRAEIARLRRLANPNGKTQYQDFDARMEVLEHQVREVQSIIALILARMNPNLRQRVLGIIAGGFIILALGQWTILEVRRFYVQDATALAVGILITALSLVVSVLFYVVRRYVAV